tara:strand:+ start:629 stop:970 length:342 start_codon:yes stop_codon:yes gene_type:complete
MNYQNSIIKNYRKIFPNRSLRVSAEEIGINMTRLHRIFNGAEMKLHEYEAFERCLRKHSCKPSQLNFIERIIEGLSVMSESELGFFEVEINHILKLKQFTGGLSTIEQSAIAQ